MKDLEKRIKSESRSVIRITNAVLKCRDCKFRWDDSNILGNTSRCIKYPLKPNEVLKGGNCPKYQKEN